MLSLESVILHIANMKTSKFVESINKYANDNVCEYMNDKIIRILKPDYFGFGFYFRKDRTDYLKKYFIKKLIKNWYSTEITYKEIFINAFLY